MTPHVAAPLLDAVVYLAAVVVLVPLFARLKLGAVLGYLAAGVVIGPGVFRLVADTAAVGSLAEFGIVLLLFVIGLELKPSRLWSLRRDIFGLGTLQVTLCGLALTGVLLVVTGLSWQAALVVGLPLGLSSTALVMQLLAERELTATPFGERVFAILLFQDIAIVPLLTIVAALSRVPDPHARSGWQQALLTLAAILVLVAAGRFLLNPLFRLIGRLGVREAFAAAALLTVLGAALLMAGLGLSMALGAFIAGVMLSESPYRHALEADIEPFRGLLLGLFFVSVGMTLDLAIVRDHWSLIALIVAAVMAAKTAVIGGLARAFGTPGLRAFQMGLLLAQGGEFGFVLFAAGTRGKLLDASAANLFGAVVTVSMLLTPFAARFAAHFNPKPVERDDLDGPEAGVREAGGARAILVGAGRFGQGVAQMLLARGVEVVAVDIDPEIIDVSNLFGNRVYFGDGTRVDILRAAGAEGAALLVLAHAGRWPAAATLGPIRDAFPHLKILARAYDRVHHLDLLGTSVDHALREVFDGSVALGREALALLDTPPATIAAIEAEFRRRDDERLQQQLCSGDRLSGLDTLFRPGTVFVPDALGEIPFQL